MASAFHGGGFWRALGERFDSLDRAQEVIDADVLDAWFDPAPGVVQALSRDISWSARTSPPTHAAGLEAALASALGIQAPSILVGAGSSALIYLALGRWLSAGSKVLIPEPTYGEYAHYCDHVVGCGKTQFLLRQEDAFQLNLGEWVRAVRDGRYDLAVLVNPNNPTGDVIAASALDDALREVPSSTRVLIDEAYFDYVADGHCWPSASQRFREIPRNVFVLKSLSKSLALSGLRVAYLAGHPDEIALLRLHTPPWAVSLPAQMAVIAALGERACYEARYRETDVLRERLSCGLSRLGFEVQFGAANWLLCQVPEAMGGAPELVSRVAERGLFLRDAGATAPSLGNQWVRVAVKGSSTQDRMFAILQGL